MRYDHTFYRRLEGSGGPGDRAGPDGDGGCQFPRSFCFSAKGDFSCLFWQDIIECRICRSDSDSGRLVRACRCSAYVHPKCLQQWLETRPGGLPRSRDGEFSSSLCCEVCKSPYLVRIETRMDCSRIFSIRSCEAYFGAHLSRSACFAK